MYFGFQHEMFKAVGMLETIIQIVSNGLKFEAFFLYLCLYSFHENIAQLAYWRIKDIWFSHHKTLLDIQLSTCEWVQESPEKLYRWISPNFWPASSRAKKCYYFKPLSSMVYLHMHTCAHIHVIITVSIDNKYQDLHILLKGTII